MKKLYFIFLIIPICSFSQSNIEIHYESNISIDFDTLKGPENFKKILKSSLSKSNLINYILMVNETKGLSIFKKDEYNDPSISKLDLLTINQILNIEGIYIKSKNKLIHDYNILDKNLKVDVEKRVSWNLVNEKKKIGNYICLKAIGEIEYGKNKGEIVEAWYAPKISLSYGPVVYDGLPGLIFEIKEKNYSLYVKKIEYTDKDIKIEVPNQDQLITEKQADKLIDEMNKKAEEYFKN
ncbi:GLPGLI family protein [Winogradskyella undariae]|uniref:GLPGLI family protein n=1 Tax=Winogradskyella undariae TaxID=1285465 RepID=UPI00156AB9CC|nr:GLPGLI family protein [Winogradskyella undariae]NRR89978.1 GLPGLI family protein [Winogradskyella undariae]